jgi:undecaprenyl-diphosphatase
MNYALFKAINQNAGHHPFLDGLMVFFSKEVFLIFALLLLVMWFFGKERSKYTVVYAVIACAAALIINFVIGHIYYEPRPFVTHKGVHLLVKHAADASFPSDHSTFAFSLTLAVLFRRHYKVGILMLVIALLTGISRVYVGNHYPFDVLGGMVVGIVISLLVYKLSSQLQPIPRVIINIYNHIPLVPKNVQEENKTNFL